MQRLLNVIKDALDPKDHIVAPNKSVTPVIVDLRAHVAYIKDQGQAGSCTAHAGTELMELLYRTQQSRLAARIGAEAISNLRFSPLFQYAQERILEGTFTSDAGADSRTIFKVLASIGCCLETEDVYEDKNILVLPTSQQLSDASQYKIGAYHRILDIDTAKTVLQSGYTFTVGTPLYPSFESDEAAATGMIALPSGTSIGGHEMHVVGCDDSKDVLGHIGAFIVQNSWGVGWGDKGYCYIPYDYFKHIMSEVDYWTCHFGKPWA